MKTTGIRELKTHLSAYIRLVRSGETIRITDRGTVVAELRPPDQTDLQSPYPRLYELARHGEAKLGAPNCADLYPAQPAVLPAGVAERLLDEERAEG
ncbi:MAG: type II toxin-antitoxin system Phd/YefM family antitoxin [bacterium]|nr:type II toxin-antitoxin system Phd/YefM family antitoxin [bacterium]